MRSNRPRGPFAGVWIRLCTRRADPEVTRQQGATGMRPSPQNGTKKPRGKAVGPRASGVELRVFVACMGRRRQEGRSPKPARSRGLRAARHCRRHRPGAPRREESQAQGDNPYAQTARPRTTAREAKPYPKERKARGFEWLRRHAAWSWTASRIRKIDPPQDPPSRPKKRSEASRTHGKQAAPRASGTPPRATQGLTRIRTGNVRAASKPTGEGSRTRRPDAPAKGLACNGESLSDSRTSRQETPTGTTIARPSDGLEAPLKHCRVGHRSTEPMRDSRNLRPPQAIGSAVRATAGRTSHRHTQRRPSPQERRASCKTADVPTAWGAPCAHSRRRANPPTRQAGMGPLDRGRPPPGTGSDAQPTASGRFARAAHPARQEDKTLK